MNNKNNISNEYITFNKYLHNVEHILHSPFKCIPEDEFRYAIHNIQCSEAPDLYAVTDNSIILFEHFEFDASHSNRKGMTGKKEEANLQRKIKENNCIGEWKIDKSNYAISFKDWQNNFESTFERHKKRIDTYVKNIKNLLNDTKKKIVVGFIVENQFSPLLNYDNEFIGEIPYFRTKQFSEFLSQSYEVDFVIFLGYLGGEPIMAFFDQQTVNDVRHSYDLTDNKLSISHLNNNELTMYIHLGETAAK